MMQTQSNLYELSLNSLQKLAWYNVEVRRGKRVYGFNIYREGDTISAFYVNQSGKKLTIVSTEEMLKMLVFEEDKKPYRDFVGDAEWILLDGMDTQRGMTRDEEAAFLYLKANVWDKLT
ncbi:hypothetical protein CN900_28350 [Bacillus anthracis]|nr:hypothetical protein COJ44_28675 [Bacillus anthracis]PFU87903.1 hypothetical protein COK92_28380 [Bacillus anthracis]PGH80187.1 hypothetical protein CN900_28350 [Bacillus anthracis]PGV28843.1 hypothetical protein COD75_28210 [Bacillus anthracis]PGX18818.1 hypothetical protein COE33_29730 [Bacillus anthracis]